MKAGMRRDALRSAIGFGLVRSHPVVLASTDSSGARFILNHKSAPEHSSITYRVNPLESLADRISRNAPPLCWSVRRGALESIIVLALLLCSSLAVCVCPHSLSAAVCSSALAALRASAMSFRAARQHQAEKQEQASKHRSVSGQLGRHCATTRNGGHSGGRDTARAMRRGMRRQRTAAVDSRSHRPPLSACAYVAPLPLSAASSSSAAGASSAASAAAATPPSSRLCVKNLPANVGEDRLRKVFGAMGDVTDVKLLKTADGRSRKMAFVGFRDQSVADKALKHFHRTFLDTSKIDVEYAVNPREAKEAIRPWSKYSEGSSRHDAHFAVGTGAGGAPAASKPAKDGADSKSAVTIAQSLAKSSSTFSKSALFGLSSHKELSKLLTDPKFQEYLHVMGSRSKNKFWSNNMADVETSAATGGKPGSMMTTAEEMAAVRGEQSFQTYEQYLAEQKAANKKQGKHTADDSDEDDDAFNQPMLERDVDEVMGKKKSKAKEAAAEPEDSEPAAAAVDPLALNSAVSDLDYLKSKAASNFEDSEDEMDDVPATAAAPAAGASAASAAPAGKKSGERKRKTAASESDDAAAATAAPAEDADEGDAGLRAEYEREQAAAEAASAQQSASDEALDSGRLFLRNLSYTVTEADLRTLFSPYGSVAEVHVPLDDHRKPKGFAYVSFMFPADALAAQSGLDGSFFLGRLLHILNSKPKPQTKSAWEQLQAMGDDAKNAMTYKKKKEIENQALAGSNKDQASWNTLFVRNDTITDAIAAKYGLAKNEILDTTSSADGAGPNMAVRLALAETQVITETKNFLAEHGVDLNAFAGPKTSTPRSTTALIVKNLPFTTDLDEIRRLFAKFGPLGAVVMPPSKAMVLLEFLEAADALKAFKGLAYKKFKYVPLYLEWAPKGAFEKSAAAATAGATPTAAAGAKPAAGVVEGKKKAASELLTGDSAAASDDAAGVSALDSSTLYVKNLNFATDEAALKTLFSSTGCPVRSVSISRKKNTKARPGTSDPLTLSMGYGFVEFRSKADATKVLAQMQGATLDGHALEVKLSSRGAPNAAGGSGAATKHSATPAADAAAAAGSAGSVGVPSSKLLVKNVPFETTARELRDLFSTFGSIQRIRLPKKFGQLGHRGFAFIDFATKNEAKNALENVKHSHLYGRHLVIEYATSLGQEEEAQDVEALRKKTSTQFAVAQKGAPPNKKRKTDADQGDEIDQAFDQQFK